MHGSIAHSYTFICILCVCTAALAVLACLSNYCIKVPAHHVSLLLFLCCSQLGGKGANLCEMAKCGVNVPPGLTITTEVCQEFYRVGECRQTPCCCYGCFHCCSCCCLPHMLPQLAHYHLLISASILVQQPSSQTKPFDVSHCCTHFPPPPHTR